MIVLKIVPVPKCHT